MKRRAGPAPDDAAAGAPDAETLAFEEAMLGARPLPPGPKVRAPLPPARGAPRPTLAVARPDADADAEPASAEGRAAGVDARLLRKLKAGDLAVEARLDLHGRTRAEAEGALDRFLTTARAAGRRCVLVIHGRGDHSPDARAVLQPLVRRRLAGHAGVLAFASARPAQGGDGATLALLRRAVR